MVEAVVLDFDGLIIDSEVAVAAAWSEVFEREGFVLPQDLWRSMVGTRENDGVLWDELERLSGRRLARAAGDSERRRRGVELSAALPALPGVEAVLRSARVHGVRIGLASSSSRWWVEGHLDRLALSHYFDAVCTREDAKRSKPFPDIYRTVLERLGVDARSALAFEDSSPGVTAAKAAGLTVVAVPGSYTEHMSFDHADEVVASLAEWSLDDHLSDL